MRLQVEEYANCVGEQAGKHLEEGGFSGPPWGEQLQGSGAGCVGEDILDIPNRCLAAAEQFRTFFSRERIPRAKWVRDQPCGFLPGRGSHRLSRAPERLQRLFERLRERVAVCTKLVFDRVQLDGEPFQMLQLMMRVEGRLRGREGASRFTEAEQHSICALDARQPQPAKLGEGLKVVRVRQTLQLSCP